MRAITTKPHRTLALILGAILGTTFGTTSLAASAADLPGQVITRAGSQAATTGSGANFDGIVRVDPVIEANADINASGAYVTFAPGARSAWHTHPKGQFLVVTAGSGRTQEWGKPVQPLQVGDVVWCPPGVKHWHGAAPDSSLTHLALTGAAGGKSVTWMEKVTDADDKRR
jgi:quercetin dioxygenase-like cupin family protein